MWCPIISHVRMAGVTVDAGEYTIGSAETASPSGISSVWCSCAKACPARWSKASRRRGRDIVGMESADVERRWEKIIGVV